MFRDLDAHVCFHPDSTDGTFQQLPLSHISSRNRRDPRWNSTSDGTGPQFVDTKMHVLQV